MFLQQDMQEEGNPFIYSSNDQLRKALEDKLFEDKRSEINFLQYASENIDKLSEAKQSKFHENLVKIGYCPHCIKTATANAQSIFERNRKGVILS